MSSTFRIFATVSCVECRMATAYSSQDGKIHEVYPGKAEFASLGLWLDSVRSKSSNSSTNWRIAEEVKPAKPAPPPLTPLQEVIQNLWVSHYLQDNLTSTGEYKRYSSHLYVLDNGYMKGVFFNSKMKTVYFGDSYDAEMRQLEGPLENAKFFLHVGPNTFSEVPVCVPKQPAPNQPIVACCCTFSTGNTFQKVKKALEDAGFFVLSNTCPYMREKFERSLTKRKDIRMLFYIHTQAMKSWDTVYENFWSKPFNLTEWIAQNKQVA